VRRCVLAAVAVASVLAGTGSAAAHDVGGGSGKYLSTISRVRPPLAGLGVAVVRGDDGLRLTWKGPGELMVLGYRGEPYLRFTAGGAVLRNARSPATYVNQDRFAKVAVPDDADASAPPMWRRVATSGTWSWHDHRIHWMSTIPPKSVRDDAGTGRTLFDWTVPLRHGTRHVAIVGTLRYVPGKKAAFAWEALFVPLLGATLLAGATLTYVFRRERRASARAARR
jgi:hypothetical protein